MLVLAAAAALVVALIGTVVARRGSSDVATVPRTTMAPSPVPVGSSSLVAIDIGGNLVEVRPDGSTARTIAPGPFLGAVSVSPADRTIYVARVVPLVACNLPRGALGGLASAGEIVAIPWSGGASTVVARGIDPVVSPDGRRVAYAADAPGQCVLSEADRVLHVIDLASGREALPDYDVAIASGGAGPTAWLSTDTLAATLHSHESCAPAGQSCGTTSIRRYRFGDGEQPPTSGGVAIGWLIGDPEIITPQLDALTVTGDGSLVGAIIEDQQTVVVRRLFDPDGRPSFTEVGRFGSRQLGLPAIVDATLAADPGSDRLAISVQPAVGLAAVGWQTVVGPPGDLQPVGRNIGGATWVPAG